MIEGVIPRLQTDRLLLREQRPEDFDRHAAMLGDPDRGRFAGSDILSPEGSWRRLLACSGLWLVLGFGYWSVERKEDGVYLGQVGFADFQRDITPTLRGYLETGWYLTNDSHGRGFASEAVAAALAWADKAFPSKAAAAIIDPGNAASIRVAEKAGFLDRRESVYNGRSTLLFVRPSPSMVQKCSEEALNASSLALAKAYPS